MEINESYLPFISLIVIPLVGWFYKMLNSQKEEISELKKEITEQATRNANQETWLSNIDKAFARRSDIETIKATIEAIEKRADRLETWQDHVRGSVK